MLPPARYLMRAKDFARLRAGRARAARRRSGARGRRRRRPGRPRRRRRRVPGARPTAGSACRARARVAGHDVHLAVVEERVGVEVRRADRQPAVVDDADLGVDVEAVDRPPRARRDRRGEEAAARVRAREDRDLAAGVVLPLFARGGRTTTTRNASVGGSRSLAASTSTISGAQRNWLSRYTSRRAERTART